MSPLFPSEEDTLKPAEDEMQTFAPLLEDWILPPKAPFILKIPFTTSDAAGLFGYTAPPNEVSVKVLYIITDLFVVSVALLFTTIFAPVRTL